MAKNRKQKSVWNKGKIIGPKPALTPDQVQAIRVVLAERAPLRDQALFSLAIDSSLRGQDLVNLRVADVFAGGEIIDKIRVQPSKTKKRSKTVIVFEPTMGSRKLLARLIEVEDLMPTDFLFSRSNHQKERRTAITPRAYLNLVKKWVGYAGLNPEAYGTHSIRRSRPAYLYRKTGNLRACQIMLGHTTIASTQKYLGVEEEEALALARQFEL